jgi:hypothetical protein
MTLEDHGVLKPGKGKGRKHFQRASTSFITLRPKPDCSPICVIVFQALTKKRKGAVAGAMNSVIGPFSGREKTFSKSTATSHHFFSEA